MGPRTCERSTGRLDTLQRPATIAATVLLVAGVLAAAGPAVASSQEPGEGTEHGHEEEHHPACRGADGERQDGSFGIDLSPFGVDREIFVPMDFGFDDEGDGIDEDEQALTICSGEHWDGQDPNTEDSSEDTRADENEGNIYINPLYGGDCSGYDTSSGHDDNAGGSHSDGCPGGSDRPTFGELLHQRVTGDVPTADDPAPDVTIYYNGEMWGLGRMAVAVHYSHADHGGYVSTHLEDHSDQVFKDTIGGPFGGSHPLDPYNDRDGDGDSEFGGDGNYLTIPFDPIQQGTGAEGDCTSAEYQDPEQDCNRDNGAFVTVQFGYAWAPLVGAGASATGPQPLP